MAMRVSPVRVTHHTTAPGMEVGRIVPMSRSPFSFFDPSWDVGTWHDFGPSYRRMEEHMRQLNQEIDQMFKRFQRLMPLDHFTPNLNMAALQAPMGSSMGSSIGSSMGSSITPALMGSSMGSSITPALMGSSMGSSITPALVGSSMGPALSTPIPRPTQMTLAVCPPPALPEPTWTMAPAIPSMGRMQHPQLSMADEWKSENPIVTNKDGSRHMRLEFDVRQFRPDEVTVRSLDNQLTVYARHQEEGAGARVFREYHRQFLLPASVQLETLSSVLSPEGVLTVTAPMPPIKALPDVSKERIIPIEYTPK